MDRICLSKFLLDEFSASKKHFICSHICDASGGRECSALYFLLSGGVSVTVDRGREVSADAGDILYLPDGAKHISRWQGHPDIEYIELAFRFRPHRDTRMDKNFDASVIRSEEATDLFALGRKIFESFERDDDARLDALADFYRMWRDLLPLLSASLSGRERSSLSPQIALAAEFIEREYRRDFRMSELAAYVKLSESRLFHRFGSEMHCTPSAYRNNLRIQRALEYLSSSAYSIGEIGDMLGFGSAAYFRKTFSAVTGMTPMEYRKRSRKGDA